MDPFRLCVALGPVAIYLLLVGTLNLFRRPFLVSGTRDAARELSCDDPAAGPMTMSYTSMPAIQTVLDRVVPEAEYQ